MRLPLGILTGVGFIGGGAILRRENLVLGVTTAATLWFVTVMGLCFGGGQTALGFASLALGLATLSVMKGIERRFKKEQRARLTLTFGSDGVKESEVSNFVASAGYKVRFLGVASTAPEGAHEMTCEIRWRALADQTYPPELLKKLSTRFSPSKMSWEML
jgi:putative Mg2+ transporter-C (MgtC) family protein